MALDTSNRDITVSVTHSLYSRFSLLLKSLLAMTRVVPAYQLCRKNENLKFSLVSKVSCHFDVILFSLSSFFLLYFVVLLKVCYIFWESRE